MEITIDTQTEYHPRLSGPAIQESFEAIDRAFTMAKSVADQYPEGKRKVYWVKSIDDCEVRFWFVVGESALNQFDDPDAYEMGVVRDNPVKVWWDEVGHWGLQPWTPTALQIKKNLKLERKSEPDVEMYTYDIQVAYDQAAEAAWARGDFDRFSTRVVWNQISKDSDAGFEWEI